MTLLEAALARGVQPDNTTVVAKLQAASRRDVDELLGHLTERGRILAEEARALLAARGADEAKKMTEILTAQKKRIEDTFQKSKSFQLNLFNDDEAKQLEVDRTHWGKRLKEIETELAEEPARIRDVYDVKAERVEPIGLAYLWPISG